MEDDVDAVQHRREIGCPKIRLQRLAPIERSERIEVVPLLFFGVVRRQAIDGPDAVTIGGQSFAQVAADEAGGTRYQANMIAPPRG
jgi:hypothetical protein